MSDFILPKEIQSALEKGHELYWQPDYPYAELRAVTYTWENGHSRTKHICLFDLRTELKKIIVIQQELGVLHHANNYLALLEEAYWKKIILFHPCSETFLLDVFGGQPIVNPAGDPVLPPA